MKRRLITAAALSVFGLALSGQAHAANFVFGDETKGATLTANESDLNIRIRLQPRVDYGDLITGKDGKSYERDKDIYLRRVRLEMSGHLLAKTIKYNLTLGGDKWDKAGNTNAVTVHYANVEWEADDAFVLRVGKEKLPYSRVSLSSSSKQLLVERPVSTEAAKKVFGKSEAFYQPSIDAKGNILEGVIAYEVAIADGWQNGEAIQTGRTVFKSDPFVGARLELSPPGWVEKKKSDAHLGQGQHLTLGVDAANQGNIEYKENAFKEKRTLVGVDLSGHYQGLTAQLEYNEWKVTSTDAAITATKPKGWYGQVGYFIDGLNIEPALRYEVYNQDSHATTDKKEKDSTVGLNWYGKGHSFKVQANWVHTKLGSGIRLANDDKKDVYQLQAQMYF